MVVDIGQLVLVSRQVVDDTGEALLIQTYDPYGSLYARAGADVTSYGFTGEQTDSSGLLYLRARYYAPSMGRFFQMDPSRLEMNPYQYAGSSPIMFTDPTGNCYGAISLFRDVAPGWCANIDMANQIIGSPHTTPWQKYVAYLYVSTSAIPFGASAAALVPAGAACAGSGVCITAAAAAEWVDD